MTKNAAEGVGQAFGYLSPAEIALMKKYSDKVAGAVRWPIIVNIGAGAGTSGLAFREAVPDAAIFTVDISLGGPLGGLEGERNEFDNAGLHYPFQILGDSKAVGAAWDTKIDLLFIDGDHSEAGLTGDILAWLPSVRDGGYVLFHDYGSVNWPDVKPVLDHLFATRKDFILIEIVDTLLVCRHDYYGIFSKRIGESGKTNKDRKK